MMLPGAAMLMLDQRCPFDLCDETPRRAVIVPVGNHAVLVGAYCESHATEVLSSDRGRVFAVLAIEPDQV